MRINGLGNVNAYKGIESTKINKENFIFKEDKYQISELGSEYQFAMKKVREFEIDRKDKVDRIKKAIDNRKYNVEASEVAEKMIAEIKLQLSL